MFLYNAASFLQHEGRHSTNLLLFLVVFTFSLFFAVLFLLKEEKPVVVLYSNHAFTEITEQAKIGLLIFIIGFLSNFP